MSKTTGGSVFRPKYELCSALLDPVKIKLAVNLSGPINSIVVPFRFPDGEINTGNKCLDSQSKCLENPTAVWMPVDGCCLVEPTKADRRKRVLAGNVRIGPW
ncbi:hypothetical protein I7I51_07783 [Histoplasma capsulatum]|uniref:Uncharacterized protein n=1 Tax=Ajellomyces capsulatus TaxID=5037 RepID=A0A8A1LWR1_AJECA|nr:hypothetical protein I7I51_07783 [Histoplasma capsulatum]